MSLALVASTRLWVAVLMALSTAGPCAPTCVAACRIMSAMSRLSWREVPITVMVRSGSALRSDAIPGRTSLLVTSLAAPRMTKLVMGFMGGTLPALSVTCRVD